MANEGTAGAPWLIRLVTAKPGKPLYKCIAYENGKAIGERVTNDPKEAMQFARKRDAEDFCAWHCNRDWKVVPCPKLHPKIMMAFQPVACFALYANDGGIVQHDYTPRLQVFSQGDHKIVGEALDVAHDVEPVLVPGRFVPDDCIESEERFARCEHCAQAGPDVYMREGFDQLLCDGCHGELSDERRNQAQKCGDD